MWTCHQSTGVWEGHGLSWTGYSGHGEGKNNPAMQHVRNVGPIPRGLWSIVGPPWDSPTHGPYVLRLEPLPGTETFGRSGFLIHGDSLRSPGEGSEGCICLGPTGRATIWRSGDHAVQVVE